MNDFLLDPLSVIIKLAILSNKPIGTKLLLKDNVIYFQEPGPFQALCRVYYNSNKSEIQYLYNPIHIACVHFLSKNNGTNQEKEKNTRIKKLFQYAQHGLTNLMETYKFSQIIVISLNYFYMLMTNHIEQTYNENMFVKDQLSEYYTPTLCSSLHVKWNDDKIKVVLGLINYLSKTNPNVKILETFMENIDGETQVTIKPDESNT